jgi:DNA invertase Pin-like site-specific DNA recombinase
VTKRAESFIAAMAEFERALIQEGVKAGLRNARAKWKKLGRPKVILDASKIAKLRAQGLGWKKISRELGVGVSTVLRIAHEARESGSETIRRTLPEPRCAASSLLGVAVSIRSFRKCRL